jgi:hypothetical protein
MALTMPMTCRGYYCSRCGLPKKGHVCIFAGELPAPVSEAVAVPPLVEPVADADYISALPDDVLGTIVSQLTDVQQLASHVLRTPTSTILHIQQVVTLS